MTEKSLKKLTALTVIAGVLMSLFDLPYASIVLISGLAAFLLLKLIKLLGTRKYNWTTLHFIQLIFIIIALAALALRYYEYPYSRVVFGVALLVESLVGVKIMLNEKFGSSNVNNFMRMVKKFLLNSRQIPR